MNTDFTLANPFPFSAHFPATESEYYNPVCRERWEYVTAYQRDYCNPKYIRHFNKYYVRLPVARDERDDLVEHFDTSRWPEPTAQEREEWELDEGTEQERRLSLKLFNEYRAAKRISASRSAPSAEVIRETLAFDPYDPVHLRHVARTDRREKVKDLIKQAMLYPSNALAEAMRTLPPKCVNLVRNAVARSFQPGTKEYEYRTGHTVQSSAMKPASLGDWRKLENRAQDAEAGVERAKRALWLAGLGIPPDENEIVERKASLGVAKLVAQVARTAANCAYRDVQTITVSFNVVKKYYAALGEADRDTLKKCFGAIDKGLLDDAEEPQPRVKAFSVAKFQGMSVPIRRWIVEGLIPDRNVTNLTGDGGAGKSLLLLQLLAGVAHTGEWIGLNVAQKGVALYFSAEDEEAEIHRRTYDICCATGTNFTDLSNLHILPYAGLDAILANFDQRTGKMLKTAAWDHLVEDIERYQPKVVAIDTLADTFNGNEMNRSQARAFVNALRGLALKYNCAIILLSHPSLSGQADGSGRSGTTGWTNSVRSRLFFRFEDGDDDIRKLTANKSNYAKVGTEIFVRYIAGFFYRQEAAGDATATQAADDKFMEVLAEFMRQGRPVNATAAPKAFADHPLGKGFDKKILKAAMERLLARDAVRVVPYGPPSRNLTKIVPQGYVEPEPEAPPAEPTTADVAMMALEQAIVAHGVDHNGHRAVTVEQWRVAAYAAGISDSDDAAARRQAFRRARKALVKNDRISFSGDGDDDGDYVWPAVA
jgi:RecA-family ATPase